MAKHTPGPWKVVQSPHGSKYRCVQYGKDDTYTSLEMLPADARLCAAAPDMLSALHAMLGLIQLIGGRDDLTPELIDVFRNNHRIAEAEAAVRKAIGSGT